MDYFMWATTILGIWAAVGPLVGVRYGQELARRNQRAHWVADSKKKEFKELLSALDTAMEAFAKHVNIINKTPKDFWELSDASNQAIRCVSDRLFILPEMNKHQIRERWFKATDELEKAWDIATFSTLYRQLRSEIISMATADIQ